MSFEFKNKTAEQIAAEIDAITSGAGEVDAAFEALKELDAAARKSAVDAFEKLLIKGTGTAAKEVLEMLRESGMTLDEAIEALPNVNDVRENLKDVDLEALKKMLGENTSTDGLTGEDKAWAELGQSILNIVSQPEEEVAANTANAQACCQMFNNVAKVKGEATDPIVKAIIQEIDTLKPADYQKSDKMMFTMIKGYKKATQGPKL